VQNLRLKLEPSLIYFYMVFQMTAKTQHHRVMLVSQLSVRITSFISIACILMLASCDRGLAPSPPALTKPVLSGTVHFIGTMPPCDSVKTLAVVVSAKAAPFSVSDIISLYGVSIFVNTIAPCSFRDTNYSFSLEPGVYKYIGVAQQYGDSLLADWRIVGFAHTEEDSAQSFTLDYGQVTTSVDIRVRFDSTSRQPFK
jgi:hypothetical protein